MSDERTHAYLARIGCEARRPPSLDHLTALQTAHLQAVPFENLHVFGGVGVRVDAEWSYAKIVEEGRGGWCFELNGCFAMLLRSLGFDVDLLSCRTHDPAAAGGLSPDFDHLALLVRVDGARWLVDVGWGDCALTPIAAEPGATSTTVPRPTRIEATGDALALLELVTRADGETAWQLQYEASLRPRQLADFHDRNVYLQTSPDSIFTQRPLATRATSAGGARVSLHADRIRFRADDLTTVDRAVAAADWDDVLLANFGMTRPRGRYRPAP